METKHNISHSISRGRVDIFSSSITATCETSGDSVELNVPYGVFRDAIKDYVVNTLSRATQEELISLMTDRFRQLDAKAEA